MEDEGGDDLDTIIEMHSNTDITAAIQIAQVLEALGIFYYEEVTEESNAKAEIFTIAESLPYMK